MPLKDSAVHVQREVKIPFFWVVSQNQQTLNGQLPWHPEVVKFLCLRYGVKFSAYAVPLFCTIYFSNIIYEACKLIYAVSLYDCNSLRTPLSGIGELCEPLYLEIEVSLKANTGFSVSLKNGFQEMWSTWIEPIDALIIDSILFTSRSFDHIANWLYCCCLFTAVSTRRLNAVRKISCFHSAECFAFNRCEVPPHLNLRNIFKNVSLYTKQKNI